MSNLTDHARYELTRAGLFDQDADYGGAHAKAVMELIETFAAQGHSGMSADGDDEPGEWEWSLWPEWQAQPSAYERSLQEPCRHD